MRSLFAIAAALALLTVPATAVAQGGSPFGPVAPSAPPPQQQQPALPTPPASEPDDDELSTTALLGLAGIAGERRGATKAPPRRRSKGKRR